MCVSEGVNASMNVVSAGVSGRQTRRKYGNIFCVRGGGRQARKIYFFLCVWEGGKHGNNV